MSTRFDKSRLKTKCKELEGVNPTFYISQIQHPLRHPGENGLPSLQRKKAAPRWHLRPTHLQYSHFTCITEPGMNEETLNKSSTSHPNPRGKITQAEIRSNTARLMNNFSISPNLPSATLVQWNKVSLFFHGFMTDGSFVMKDL